jgi:putative PIN family toxin of toxin-antitoxin system
LSEKFGQRSGPSEETGAELDDPGRARRQRHRQRGVDPCRNSPQILDAWRDERFALLVSPAILEEIVRVLEYPKIARLHRWPRARVEEFVAEFGYLGIMTHGDLRLDVVRNDPADNRYLECALEGTADYLVSGDQDLLDLREHGGVPIVTPRTFRDVRQVPRRRGGPAPGRD